MIRSPNFKKMSAYLILAFLSLNLGTAQARDERVPDEFYIAKSPDLGPIGPARLHWFFLRPPLLWVQGEMADLSKVRWPLWDQEQMPLSLVPQPGTLAEIILFDAKGEKIDEFMFNRAFVPDDYVAKTGKLPSSYRIRLLSKNRRWSLLSEPYSWIQQKEVFRCEVEFRPNQKIENSSRVQECIDTLKTLPAQAKQQWWVRLDWPAQKESSSKAAISTWDREFRSTFRKAKHSYESQKRPNRTFLVKAGVTNLEKAQAIGFDISSLKSTQAIQAPPDREVKASESYFWKSEKGQEFKVYAFAADEIVEREIRAPDAFNPGIQVQFVSAADGSPSLKSTEFKENHTGFVSYFRRWQGSAFISLNDLTSQRGEKLNQISAPGFDLSVNSGYWGLYPYLSAEPGLLHLGSSLGISEYRLGATRDFDFLPENFSLSAGGHLYQLSGTNTGSSRLGKYEAISLGGQFFERKGDDFILARASIMYGQGLGFDSRWSWGRVISRKTDMHVTGQIFLGYSRYSGQLTTRTLTNETFTEDRLQIGFSLGFIGPESYQEASEPY